MLGVAHGDSLKNVFRLRGNHAYLWKVVVFYLGGGHFLFGAGERSVPLRGMKAMVKYHIPLVCFQGGIFIVLVVPVGS